MSTCRIHTVHPRYGGEEAGTGLADVLFGRVVAAGRLPITFYAATSQLAPFESYDMRGGGRTFRCATAKRFTLNNVET